MIKKETLYYFPAIAIERRDFCEPENVEKNPGLFHLHLFLFFVLPPEYAQLKSYTVLKKVPKTLREKLSLLLEQSREIVL